MKRDWMLTKVTNTAEGELNEIIAVALTHSQAADFAMTLASADETYGVRPWNRGYGELPGKTWTRDLQ